MRRSKGQWTPSNAEADDCARFWGKVNKCGGFVDFADPLVRVTEEDGECWEWTAFAHPSGYGFFSSQVMGYSLGAHRVAYFLEHGVWSSRKDGTTIDHLCRNKLCVRHLEMVSERENAIRGAGPTAVNNAKTHCIHGHEFTAENTYLEAGGGRKCRICRRNKSNKWARKKRLEQLGLAA
jgi:hypothetical protein